MASKENTQVSFGGHKLQWYCPPPSSKLLTTEESAESKDAAQKERLEVQTAGSTDYWQRTHYGFRVDNGHFLKMPYQGAFQMSVRVDFSPVHQYDQAGLMVRVPGRDGVEEGSCWIKTSVEYEGPEADQHMGVVVTNKGYSDWSTQAVSSKLRCVWLRISRQEDDFMVFGKTAEELPWQQMRMCHLHDCGSAVLEIGVYACSPKGKGMTAVFSEFRVQKGTGS